MLSSEAQKNKNLWAGLDLTEEEKREFESTLNSGEDAIEDSFGASLEFGTGGLRGIMGPGTNRMNRFTIGSATQGLSNYLLEKFPDEEIKVAIAHDSRINSPEFTEICSRIFSANGIKVFVFPELRPTPELSFAIRELRCKSGVVITASHNPPEYNGYKVYFDDGAQIISPQDKEIVETIRKIAYSEINFEGDPELIEVLDRNIDEKYLESTLNLIPGNLDTGTGTQPRIVFSPIHGTGITMVPEVLSRAGFNDVHVVKEQSEPNGNFPTVKSPNPEEKAALQLSLDLASKIDADLIMATDPDSDRVGIAVKDNNGQFRLLNGNQTGALLFDFLLSNLKGSGSEEIKDPFCVKTIVTSDLLSKISESYGVECMDTLTGFKYIADLIRKNESKRDFLIGAEESYGYLIGDEVRDKDAISSCLLIAVMCKEVMTTGSTLYNYMGDIYSKHGLYVEGLRSVVKKGLKGKEEIGQMMNHFRENGLAEINGSRVRTKRDFLSGEEKDLQSGSISKIDLPGSNVLQFESEDGSKISMRPSGTEPKIKFYLSSRMASPEGDWGAEFAKGEELNLDFLNGLTD